MDAWMYSSGDSLLPTFSSICRGCADCSGGGPSPSAPVGDHVHVVDLRERAEEGRGRGEGGRHEAASGAHNVGGEQDRAPHCQREVHSRHKHRKQPSEEQHPQRRAEAGAEVGKVGLGAEGVDREAGCHAGGEGERLGWACREGVGVVAERGGSVAGVRERTQG